MEQQELRVLMVTWNVANKFPKEDLHELLGLKSSTGLNTHLPDVYAIGYQEAPLRVSSLIWEEEWVDVVRNLLSMFGFVKVTQIRILGIVLAMFVKKPLVTRLRNIEVNYTKTGFGGYLGNKGGVSVRFNVKGGSSSSSSVCLVNCHLAAHDHKLERRISDYHDIVYGQRFKDLKSGNILSHDYVIIMGDLNFRINDYNTSQILERVKTGSEESLKELLLNDQLNIVRKEKRAFSEFTEKEPKFMPTFKYKVGTSTYDTKKRKPAFTDRILFRIKDDSVHPLVQSNYRSHPDYCQSDHKPVSSLFTLKLGKKIGSDVTDGELDGEEEVEEPAFVTFDPIHYWKINEDSNWIRFRFTDTKGTSNRSIASRIDRSQDWIGVFAADFSSLDQWITYVWADDLGDPTNQMQQRAGSGVDENPDEEQSLLASSSPHGHISGGSFFSLYFPCLLTPSSFYRLIYFSGLSALGISDPFQARI